ncbi:MAG TPA: MBL fold metallo-hydrolase [bacterium]|nr:MBL fold metallo-hydrolase [bacterium]
MPRFRRSGIGATLSVALALILIVGAIAAGSEQTMRKKIEKLSITILYDNNPGQAGLATDWGFSCLIRADERVLLFDTGGDGTLLLANMKKLGVDPAQVKTVMLSHHHRDHVGGLDDFLARQADADVYYPATMGEGFAERIRRTGARPVAVTASTMIAPGLYTTGVMGAEIPEQALVVDTPTGSVVVAGCAHSGIVTMVEKARTIVPGPVRLALGGFHLFRMNEAQQRKIAVDLQAAGVQKIAPCHCSGDKARDVFKLVFGDNYLAVGVGSRLDL